MKKPRSITTICFFYWFNALYLGIVSIVSLLLLFGPFLNGAVSFSDIFNSLTPLDYFFSILPLLGIGMTVYLAITGWGLWKLKRWGRSVAITSSGILVTFGFLTMVMKFSQGEFGIPYLLILHGVVLWVLFRDDVKVVFGVLSLASTDWGDEAITDVLSGQNICFECGMELREGAAFCHQCGAQRPEINIAS